MKAVLHTSCVSAVLGQLGGLQMPPLSGSLSTPPPSAGPMGVQMPPGMMGGGGAAPPQGRPSIAIGPMLSPNGQPIGGQEMPQGTNVVANAMAASSMGGGAPGLVGNAGQIDPLQKMMNEMMQSPDLDGKVCADVPRKQTNVGKECWENIWAFVGCKKENSPQYEQWHAAQSLEILAIDALQWAHLDDPKHKDACYGNNGPPAPQAPQGLSGSMLMGGQGGAPSGGGMAGMPPLGGAGPGQMQMPQQQQPPANPQQAALEQAIAGAVQQLVPQMQQACGVQSSQQTNVGPDCWSKAWAAVGCLPEKVPPYEQWHAGQSLEVLVADVAQWAALPTEKHRMACYGKMEL